MTCRLQAVLLRLQAMRIKLFLTSRSDWIEQGPEKPSLVMRGSTIIWSYLQRIHNYGLKINKIYCQFGGFSNVLDQKFVLFMFPFQ